MFTFYELDPSLLNQEDTQISNVEVIIEAARSGQYFDIEEIDERYVRLQGGVQLRLVDNQASTVHTIRAEELIFNQDQEFVTARGDVEYTIDREGQQEEFSGETLIFQIESWQGVFLVGRGANIPGSDTQTVFRYEADLITRSTDDIVVMEEAVITSSPAADPYYHIKAEKIWILGPAEWALSNATLYVGEVPLFYFPYFFRPGDEILFHPVFGSREREGIFIQTTTYLSGRKESAEDDNFFSFLQSNLNTDREQFVDGIFLRNSTERIDSQQAAREPTLRLLVDFYSRLGGYLGLEGDFSNSTDIFNTLTFDTAIALNRYLYRAGGEDYTTLYNDNGTPTEYLVHSYFLGTEIPLRYLIDFQLGLSTAGLSSSIIFQYYSDRYLTSDFADRAEENDWYGIVLGEEELVTTSTVSDTTSFLWRLTSSYTVPEFLSPFISQLRINDLLLGVNWAIKQTPTDQLPAYITAADRAPQSYFFFPQTIFAPNASLSVSGTLISPAIVSGDASLAEQGEQLQIELRPPWDQSAESADSEDEDETTDDDTDNTPTIRVPAVQADESGYRIRNNVDYGVTYTLRPSLSFQHNTANEEWLMPADIDFSLLYSTLTSDNTLDVDFFVNFFENYLLLNSSFDITGRYRTIYDGATISESQSEQLAMSAAQYNYFGITNTTSLSSNFLQELDAWKSSVIRYSIGGPLYQYRFSEFDTDNAPIYEEVIIAWDREILTTHSADLQFVWDTPIGREQLSLSYRLPPFLQQFSTLLSLQFGPVALETRFSADEQEDMTEPWLLNPLINTLTINVLDELSLSGQLQTNLEEEYVDSLSLTLRTWFLTTTLLFRHSEEYTFNRNFAAEGLVSPWQIGTDLDLRPISLRSTASESLESDPLWKGRLRIGANINGTLNLDLQQFTQSSLNASFSFTFFFFEFLDIRLSTNISNDQIYLYIPELADITGREPRNLFIDLLQSINIFNMADLEQGLFKLQSLSLDITHHLVDWDLTFGLRGQPILISDTAGSRYEWDQEISITIAWQPIPELRRDITIDREDVITIE